MYLRRSTFLAIFICWLLLSYIANGFSCCLCFCWLIFLYFVKGTNCSEKFACSKCMKINFLALQNVLSFFLSLFPLPPSPPRSGKTRPSSGTGRTATQRESHHKGLPHFRQCRNADQLLLDRHSVAVRNKRQTPRQIPAVRDSSRRFHPPFWDMSHLPQIHRPW